MNFTAIVPLIETCSFFFLVYINNKNEERSFDKVAAVLWNDLPRDLRNIRSVNVFKKILKTDFFRNAYLNFIVYQ